MADEKRIAELEAALAGHVRVEAELRRRIEELEDLVEHVEVGLHRVGSDGTIVWANAAELALMGRTRDEYVGRNIAEFHVDPAAAAEILRRLAAGEVLRDHPARLLARDGSTREVLITSSAWLRDGEIVHTRCHTRLAPGERPAPREPASASLTVILGERRVPVTGERFTIGRSVRNDLVIADANISRVHCVIERTAEGYVVADSGSTCGIEIDGRRIIRHLIADGDVLELCDHRVEFHLR